MCTWHGNLLLLLKNIYPKNQGWPTWSTVSALVSKQTVTYNAQPKKCPTRDMVFVDLNLSINFRIGPDIDRVQE